MGDTRRRRSELIVHGVKPAFHNPSCTEALPEVHGAWEGSTAGGCMNYPTWMDNPQYTLHCPQAGKISLSMTQIIPNGEGILTMGAYIFEGSNLHGYRISDPSSTFAAKISFINLETVGATITVTEPRTYLIVPCTFEKGHEREFTLKVNTDESGATLTSAFPWSLGTIPCRWTQQFSGGSMNVRSWQHNPTFNLTVSGTDPCTFTIVLFVEEDLSSKIGFYLFEDVRGSGEPVVMGLRGHPPFKSGHGVSFTFKGLDPGNYIVLPCTMSPKHIATFYIGIPEGSSGKERCSLRGPFYGSNQV